MMKLKTGNVVVLGLSHANLDRLREAGLSGGIQISGKELGIDVDIWITAAPDERAMIRAFQDGIGPETDVRIDKRLTS